MFKRLNTGGSILSSQEIRNCSLRMLEGGAAFYTELHKLSRFAGFQTAISTLSDTDRDQKGDEELVVRFLALKNGREYFRGSVRDWLDKYLESILVEHDQFDWNQETAAFEQVFSYIAETFESSAFVKYRDGKPLGALAPAYFEAVSMGVYENLPGLLTRDRAKVRASVVTALESDDFRAQTGPGANSRPKLARRIEIISNAVRV